VRELKSTVTGKSFQQLTMIYAGSNRFDLITKTFDVQQHINISERGVWTRTCPHDCALLACFPSSYTILKITHKLKESPELILRKTPKYWWLTIA